MLQEKKLRMKQIYVINTIATVFLIVALAILVYIFIKGINYTYDDYGNVVRVSTAFKWYHWAIPMALAVLLYSWGAVRLHYYRETYVVIRKGKVVGLYQNTEGAAGIVGYVSTYYYVTIEGLTAAGEESQYSLSIEPTIWDTLEKGQEVDFS